jgi:hypothetical protein
MKLIDFVISEQLTAEQADAVIDAAGVREGFSSKDPLSEPDLLRLHSSVKAIHCSSSMSADRDSD